MTSRTFPRISGAEKPLGLFHKPPDTRPGNSHSERTKRTGRIRMRTSGVPNEHPFVSHFRGKFSEIVCFFHI